MKKLNFSALTILQVCILLLIITPLFLFATTATYANQSPPGCTGSGLGINLFSNVSVANIGDTILFSIRVFNGTGGGPVVCDASGIQAFIVTPDGISHPITLTRTDLSDGQSDMYTNIVSYVAQAADVKPDGTLKATASDTGVIHQNVVNSLGGSSQGLDVQVSSSVPEFGLFTASVAGLSSLGGYLLIKYRKYRL
jgi:hypothetical protein